MATAKESNRKRPRRIEPISRTAIAEGKAKAKGDVSGPLCLTIEAVLVDQACLGLTMPGQYSLDMRSGMVVQ